MRDIYFDPKAERHYSFWEQHDKKILEKIDNLIDDILKTPFEGLGKPEPLKHQLKGFWSRRINKEHRLVYQVTDNSIIVISCRFHY
jgi:toxin YoeB